MTLLPLQLPIPIGQSPLLIAALVFAVVLAGILLYIFGAAYSSGNPWDDFADAAHAIVDAEDADAIAFIPYSDGPLLPKPAIYDRELLGGKGGYRTPDGERIYVDGQGNGMFSLQGVDVVLAIDPTEHAAAVDPLKAYIAHEKNVGRWIKVDRDGELLEAGEALANVDGDDGPTPAMEVPKNEGVAPDGGYRSRVHEHAIENGMELEDALASLEQADGEIHKIVDLAPPRAVNVDEQTGEVNIEEATHVAVDVSEAADLLPKKTNTTSWQTMEEKARQEGADPDRDRENLLIGAAAGAIMATISAVLMALVFGFM